MKDPRLLRQQVLHTLATTMDAFVKNLQADKRYKDQLKLDQPAKADKNVK